MGKGSGQRPTDHDKFSANYDRIFSKTEGTVYFVETPTDIFWSRNKMEAQYKHVEFFWRDRAKYKEMSENKFKNYLGTKSKKKVWELKDD